MAESKYIKTTTEEELEELINAELEDGYTLVTVYQNNFLSNEYVAWLVIGD
jgi:hypothetical protein